MGASEPSSCGGGPADRASSRLVSSLTAGGALCPRCRSSGRAPPPELPPLPWWSSGSCPALVGGIESSGCSCTAGGLYSTRSGLWPACVAAGTFHNNFWRPKCRHTVYPKQPSRCMPRRTCLGTPAALLTRQPGQHLAPAGGSSRQGRLCGAEVQEGVCHSCTRWLDANHHCQAQEPRGGKSASRWHAPSWALLWHGVQQVSAMVLAS